MQQMGGRLWLSISDSSLCKNVSLQRSVQSYSRCTMAVACRWNSASAKDLLRHLWDGALLHWSRFFLKKSLLIFSCNLLAKENQEVVLGAFFFFIFLFFALCVNSVISFSRDFHKLSYFWWACGGSMQTGGKPWNRPTKMLSNVKSDGKQWQNWHWMEVFFFVKSYSFRVS